MKLFSTLTLNFIVLVKFTVLSEIMKKLFSTLTLNFTVLVKIIVLSEILNEVIFYLCIQLHSFSEIHGAVGNTE